MQNKEILDKKNMLPQNIITFDAKCNKTIKTKESSLELLTFNCWTMPAVAQLKLNVASNHKLETE